MNIEPLLDYVLVEIIKADSGVVTSTDVASTEQYGKVIKVGKGAYEFGVFIEPTVKEGDLVYLEAYADGTNVPKVLRDKGYVLVKSNRIMAKEY